MAPTNTASGPQKLYLWRRYAVAPHVLSRIGWSKHAKLFLLAHSNTGAGVGYNFLLADSNLVLLHAFIHSLICLCIDLSVHSRICEFSQVQFKSQLRYVLKQHGCPKLYCLGQFSTSLKHLCNEQKGLSAQSNYLAGSL